MSISYLNKKPAMTGKQAAISKRNVQKTSCGRDNTYYTAQGTYTIHYTYFTKALLVSKNSVLNKMNSSQSGRLLASKLPIR